MEISETLKVDCTARVICVDAIQRVLLIWRSEISKHRPNGRDFPGGKRERDETSRQAAKREFREEVGIDINEERLIRLFDEPILCDFEDGTSRLVDFFVYLIESINPDINLDGESKRFEWVSQQHAKNELDQPVQKQAMEHAISTGALRSFAPRYSPATT